MVFEMSLIVVLHNIRSVYNVGAILRTAEGFGVRRVVCAGYTPCLGVGLPHEQEKLRRQMHKTALGAEELVECVAEVDLVSFIEVMRQKCICILALERAVGAVNLADFRADFFAQEYALILGEEVHGIAPEILEMVDVVLEVPMVGQKESFNVAVAEGIALWELTKGGYSSERPSKMSR